MREGIMRHLRRPDVRLVFAVGACLLLLLDVPFAAGFAIWLAYGPPPEQPVIVPLGTAPEGHRRRDVSAPVVDLVA
jgi:hypothetical protein